MPGEGRLSVATGEVTLLDALRTEGVEPVRPGRYGVLSVTDSGSGMTPETLARMFEPFFTTKGVGEGSGLGLSTVYGIVRQLGGDIQAMSEVGRGTTFTVRLPLHLEDAPESMGELGSEAAEAELTSLAGTASRP